MFSFSSPFRLLLFAVLLAGAGSVWAQPKTRPQPQPEPQPATSPQPPASQPQPQPKGKGKEKGNRSTLPDSVRRVERQTGGEVLRAEPMQRDGREVYRLKVLTADGRVRVVQEDPSDHGEKPARKNDKAPSDDSDGDPPQF